MGHTVRKVNTGLFVLVVVVSLGSLVAAVIAFAGSGKVYEQLGKGAFELDREGERSSGGGPPVDSPAARAEAAAEIRQLVEAKAARQAARGEALLDVEAEIARLTAEGAGHWALGTGHSEELRDEVRQLVIARNERRTARGQEPLDVEAEVERQLRDLAGE
jgi:hypothetical protein